MTETLRWHRRMRAGDPDAPHRVASPLELLFDLAFVVAVGFVVEELAHAVTEGHAGFGLLSYLMVFFAIWWAWVNFSHFGSVYDVDDVPYRLLTLVQIGGVLVLAAGVSAAFEKTDFTVITIGYVIMRFAMVAQWFRAALEYPPGRSSALRFASGILLVQLGWVLRLLLPDTAGLIGFFVLVLAELAVPVWAETRGATTSWHPAHLAERYGLFVLIVLGEQVVSSANAIIDGLHEHLGEMALLAGCALVVLFTMWWLYFDREDHLALESVRGALSWSYGHYVVLASAAATGAGVEVAIAKPDSLLAGLALAIPVGVYLIAVWLIRGGLARTSSVQDSSVRGNSVRGNSVIRPIGGVLVLAAGFAPHAPVIISVLLLAVVASTVTR